MTLLQAFLPDIKAEVLQKVSKISIVGVGMRNHPGVAAQFFQALSQLHIPIHLVTTSEIKISAIIDQKHLSKAINHLHTCFHLDHPQTPSTKTHSMETSKDGPL